LWCKAYHADISKIINTNGAGDTAVAAFLSAILDGDTAETSLKYAAMAGRNTLYCHNIHTDLSDWQEISNAINSESNEIIHFKTFAERTPNKNAEIKIARKI
jgi:sugar/nucleoside kinase (ribokinase family)